MNILVITAKYYIEGRPDLLHDTSAIHYLVKYWAEEHNVKVFNAYRHRYSSAVRFLHKKNRDDYRKRYEYEADGVSVCLSETQLIPLQKCHYTSRQASHFMLHFKQWIEETSFSPDVIVIHFPSYYCEIIGAVHAFFGKKVPVVGVLHQTDISMLKRGWISPEALDDCCGMIFSRSKAIRERAREYGVRNLREGLVLSGVPLQGESRIRRHAVSDPAIKLLYAGKLIKRKNIDAVLYAIQELKKHIEISFEIVGSGREGKKLQKLCDTLGIREQVRFSGSVPREEVFKKMSDADLFCMPSIDETFGLTYLEAMSVGCIPIGTKNEGIDGIVVDRENGYLVDRSRMVKDIVDSVLAFSGLPDEEKEKMRHRSFDSAKQYNEEKCSHDYLDLVLGAYEKLVHG